MKRIDLGCCTVIGIIGLTACQTRPPGHDPHGPRTSEHPPGHNKVHHDPPGHHCP